jgi:hypothetical protein
MKQTRQAVCAIKQSIFLDVYGLYTQAMWGWRFCESNKYLMPVITI